MRLFDFRKKKVQQVTSSVQSVECVGVTVEAVQTAEQTRAYKQQYSQTAERLKLIDEKNAQWVLQQLQEDPTYQDARSRAVEQAWKYEKALVEMRGTGTTDWNSEQLASILEKGKVPGAEGHHIKNVAAHPEEQGNADNIVFYKDRQEHLQKGHGGSFQNDSDGDMLDRQAMLEEANQDRVTKNEIGGVLAAAMLGFGVGGGIAFIVTLAENGLTRKSFLAALKKGIKTGAVSGVQSAVGYGISRAILPAATETVEKILTAMGLAEAEKVAEYCGAGIGGTVVVAVFQMANFIRLKKKGCTTKEALLEVGKQAGMSELILLASIMLGGIFGQMAALIFSFGITCVSLLGTLCRIWKEKREAVYLESSFDYNVC